MRRTISRSSWRTLLATLVAITGFVLLYEATTIDSVWPWSPRPVDPTQPVPGARLQFSATAYCKGATTASGVTVRTGIAAADKGLLPVGSVVTITTDNTRYNGVYTVMDTGPEVQGKELDLYMWSCHEALAFGRKQVQVEVLRLGWNPNASTPGLIDRLFRRAARRPAPSTPEVIPPASREGADESDASAAKPANGEAVLDSTPGRETGTLVVPPAPPASGGLPD
jgi:3D (Asp-Asp-Asp) domain-containing protein